MFGVEFFKVERGNLSKKRSDHVGKKTNTSGYILKFPDRDREY